MTSLLFSKEMATSLRAIFDLAFAASLLALRWIRGPDRQRGCEPQSHASKSKLRAPRAIWVNENPLGNH